MTINKNFTVDTGLEVTGTGGDLTLTGGNVVGANVLNANTVYTDGTGGDITMTGGNIANLNAIVTANDYPTLLAYGSNGHGGPEMDYVDTNSLNPYDIFENSSTYRNVLYLNGEGVYIGINENGASIPATRNQWRFDTNGVFYAGGNIVVNGVNSIGPSSAVSGNVITGGIYTDNYYYANGSPFTPGSNYGNSNVVTLLASYGSNSISTTGNVQATNFVGQAANVDLVAGSYAWKFDTTGNMTFQDGTGNVTLVADAQTWNFDTTGNLTVPGRIKGASSYNQPSFIVPNGSDAGWAFGSYSDGGSNFWMQTQFYGQNQATRGFRVLESEGNTVVFSVDGTGNATVAGNITADNIGNVAALNLDGNASNILYGNGVFSAAPAITSTIANGTSNVTIATAAGNVVTNVGAATALTVSATGIRVHGGGSILSPGGATSITLNNNGANIPTANITTFANITGAGNALNVVNSANIGGNLTVTGNITGNTNGFAIGYLNIPQIAASNTTLAATDGGKHYYSTTAGNFTLTIPNNATTSFATGTAISVVVQAAGNILVNAASGVTLYMAGNSTSANRVIGAYGMATLMKVASDTWFINGTGVS